MGSLANEANFPSIPTGASVGVSTSPNGRGVSGGFASVEMSERASEGVSNPDEDVEFGSAE